MLPLLSSFYFQGLVFHVFLYFSAFFLYLHMDFLRWISFVPPFALFCLFVFWIHCSSLKSFPDLSYLHIWHFFESEVEHFLQQLCTLDIPAFPQFALLDVFYYWFLICSLGQWCLQLQFLAYLDIWMFLMPCHFQVLLRFLLFLLSCCPLFLQDYFPPSCYQYFHLLCPQVLYYHYFPFCLM